MGKRKRKAVKSPASSEPKRQKREETSKREKIVSDVEAKDHWRQWGPYLSERQWGTVREDHSHDGNCWEHFPHSHAPFRAYEQGEDGLMGFCDDQAKMCIALALWNGKDPILKERLFGLNSPEGNHGEDVKECYYYLDGTPDHSYMKGLYKYPQQEFPYQSLVEENKKRTVHDREFELVDTGIFDESEYWDVEVEYAKASPQDVLCQYKIYNRGDRPATIHVLPTVWFRNTWSSSVNTSNKPSIQKSQGTTVICKHPDFHKDVYCFEYEKNKHFLNLLFTENETNWHKVGKSDKESQQFTKEAFHDYLINGQNSAVNHKLSGTKCAGLYKADVDAGSYITIRCRLFTKATPPLNSFGKPFEDILNQKNKETDHFYNSVIPAGLSPAQKLVARQAYAGMLWTKQYFGYDVDKWHNADPDKKKINPQWRHMVNSDIISMPDKWEFPWYATWDLAFHMIPFVDLDPKFAKDQLTLMLSDHYMHPNGQLPAYEFNFSDVNPPVHAWACMEVYKSEQEKDCSFLKKVFNRLLLNFNWWINKKDEEGRHIFGGGFLGMDNISCIDRSKLPDNYQILQVDGTAWMAFYSLCLIEMALELGKIDEIYEEMACRFLQHFQAITKSINHPITGLWDSEGGFYYDQLKRYEGQFILKIHSMVGLLPLIATSVLPVSLVEKFPTFHKKLRGLSETSEHVYFKGKNILLSMTSRHQTERITEYLCDENEFLSPYGIRSVSKIHENKPFHLDLDGKDYSISYSPGESTSDMFGGNSNWRGPVWLCMNYLLVESLEKRFAFYGDSVKAFYPHGSSRKSNMMDIAQDLCTRITQLFIPDNNNKRPCHGEVDFYSDDPHWKNLVLFHEYFHAETGRGCGASHQTGWTGLIVAFMKKIAPRPEEREQKQTFQCGMPLHITGSSRLFQ